MGLCIGGSGGGALGGGSSDLVGLGGRSGGGHNNNFATLRTTSIVTRQLKEHARENQLHEQMSGYKRMRRQHQKAIIQLEMRCRAEIEEHKTKLDKEYETLLGTFSKELEKLQAKHQQELDKKVCSVCVCFHLEDTKLKLHVFFTCLLFCSSTSLILLTLPS